MKIGLGLKNLFQPKTEHLGQTPLEFDRITRELKGSIFALITLFELAALTSYIPIDSLNIFDGRLDHVNNLGGIVGALLAEWFLGSVGISGYALIALTGWMAFTLFRGTLLKDKLFKIMGIIQATILAAIACYLVFHDHFPEMSLLQGGLIGKNIGSFLARYFNFTGALLIIGGCFILTFILTTDFSITSFVRSIFADKDLDTDEEEFPETGGHGGTPEFETKQERNKRSDLKNPSEKPKKKPPKKKKTAKKSKKASEENEEPTEEIELASLNEDDLDSEDADEPDTLSEESQEELDIDPENDEEKGEFVFKESIPFTGSHDFPSTRLLKNHTNGAKRLSKGEIRDTSDKLSEHLLSFQITGGITGVSEGPVITTFEYKPSAGIKLSRIASLQDDLGVVLGTRELRIVAPIPGKTVVGIEVPRPTSEIISLKDIVCEKEFSNKKLRLPIALGKATDGTPLFDDLSTMPHLLVAGATGSGKSVFINCLISGFLYRLEPKDLRLILIDPKMLELNVFDGIPHLLAPAITRSHAATNAFKWAVEEMERRYDLMAEASSKNIDSYNSKERNPQKRLPFIVIIVDELADLMFSGDREEVEIAITRLAQKARAAGIHLVIATQRPSTDVITGLIKANIPSRISFKVPSSIDSRTILDTSGAEDLIGHGDSLMVRPASLLKRIHACFISEEELARVVKNVQGGKNYEKFYISFD